MAQASTSNSKKEFETLLVNMMDVVDDITEKYDLLDSEYKVLGEGIMKLYNAMNNITTNTIYIAMERRVRNPQARRKTPPSLEEKMTSEKYEWCAICNTPIKKEKNNMFMKQHLETQKCSQIGQTKMTTIKKPIFRNATFDMPLQVINRCIWRKMKRVISIPPQWGAMTLYNNNDGDNWYKVDDKWFHTSE